MSAVLYWAMVISLSAICIILFISWRMKMKKVHIANHNYVEFEAMREEMLYRDREQKASRDRIEGLCKEYEETFRAMQIMDELEGRQ